ncbi:hypothetical protein [Kitasatospora sp. GP82]|uniref:hypothetical protein n=1 Tax=Kitasatospora sp. GP82 TaxID=3035089 RepID=UPI002475DAA9|nr:hypothetical protein [Kitasatospora sp. GP82]MDH6126817.1 hypothetical protein [Kitasatospora sp. GP82]
MTDQDNTAPAVWDPTARGGAGGWVRRKPAQAQQDTPAEPGFPPPQGAPSQQGAPQQQWTPSQPAAPQQHTSAPYGFASPQDAQTAKLPPVPLLPPSAPPSAGAFGDEGPPLTARPYLNASPPPPAAGYGQPGGFPAHSAEPTPPPGFPSSQPTPPAFPPAQTPLSGQGPGYPGPGYPAPAPYEELAPYEGAQPRRRTPLFVALGVALAVVVGVGAVWLIQDTGDSKGQAQPGPASPGAGGGAPPPAPGSTGSTSPDASPGDSPSASASDGAGPNAAAQAKSLDDLLTRGEGAKAPIGNAVAKVNSCPSKSEIDNAVHDFEAGAAQRDQLIADLNKLDLGQLPGGADAAQTLRSAWQQSGDIDRAYAAWARTVSSQGCTNGAAPDTDDLKRANDLNPQATQTKKDFVTKWNSMAGTYNLPSRTWDRI